jgi:hypothetical protein
VDEVVTWARFAGAGLLASRVISGERARRAAAGPDQVSAGV